MIPTLLLVASSSPRFQAEARQYDVGGRDGWVAKPSEDYNHWAQRNRFQVNDTLRESNLSHHFHFLSFFLEKKIEFFSGFSLCS